MKKLRWLSSNAMIECESYDDLGPILKLYNGIIRHPDESVSRFDLLILQRSELEEMAEPREQKKGRETTPRRRRSPR